MRKLKMMRKEEGRVKFVKRRGVIQNVWDSEKNHNKVVTISQDTVHLLFGSH
jgi:hypothetical protein